MNRKETKTTGIDPYIVECIVLRYSEKESLNYLEDKGYSISRAEYYRIKEHIKNNAQTRLNLIASQEFLTQHIERLDTLRTIQSELFEQYKKEQSPLNKARILMYIAEIQGYLASFYDSTQYVIERGAIIKKRKKQEQEITNEA